MRNRVRAGLMGATAMMLAGTAARAQAPDTAPMLRGQPANGAGPQAEAQAQTPATPTDNALAAADPTRAGGGANPADIVVTGSRIVRNGYQAPTPVTVVTTQQLVQAAPTNLPDGLKQLPQIQGSVSDTRSVGNANRPDNGNYLNLRGVGPVRSLVLLDGRRVPPTSYQGTVDVNTIPQALISRVDVVTAGASAVYGADAVSGVINFVLDTNYKGVKGSLQRGLTTYGDDASTRATLAAGTNVGERMHVEGSIEWFKRDGIRHRYDRPYLITPAYGTTGSGTAADPYVVGVPNVLTVTRALGGLVTSGPFRGTSTVGMQFAPNGSLSPFNYGQPTGNSSTRIGGDGVFPYPEASLTGGLETKQAFGYAHYELTDRIKLFAQAGYAQSLNDYTGIWDFHTINVYEDNPYLTLTPAQRAALVATRPAGGGAASFSTAKYGAEWGAKSVHTNNKSLNATGGIQGKFGDGYNFELSYTHGRSTLETHAPEAFNQRFYAAADAVDAGQFRTGVANGQVVCRVTLVNPSLLPGCQPADFVGVMTPAQAAAAKAYIFGDSSYRDVNTLDEVAGNIGGSPFATWAGPVSFNVNANWRRQGLKQTSNGDPSQVIDYTGIRGVPSGTTPFFFTNVGLAAGHYTVYEGNIEAVVPIAKDITLLRDLELNGAYRYTHYSTSGGVSTWKAGLTWQPFDGLRIRATRSHDIRAPTLFDLFAGQQVNPENYTDTLLGNRTYVILTRTSGNPNLKPEQGDTTSVGAIIQPAFVRGLSLSVDYYRLKITDAITNVSSGSIRDVCFASNGTSPLCALQPRALGSFTNTDPANVITTSILDPINIASLSVEGIDFDLTYSFGLSTVAARLPGRLTLRAYLAYQPHYYILDGLGGRRRDLVDTIGGGVDAPDAVKVRGLASIAYNNGGFDLFVQGRYISATERDTPENTARVYANGHTPARVYFDTTISYAVPGLGGRLTPFLSINNVFNRKQPISNPQGSVYDPRGRYFTTGVRVSF